MNTRCEALMFRAKNACADRFVENTRWQVEYDANVD